MLKKRLINLLAHAKKYIVYQILWQIISLLCQVGMIFILANILELIIKDKITTDYIFISGIMILIGVFIRFYCEKKITKATFLASIDVKLILREKIFEKMIALGTSYKEKVSTAAVVQMATEGVEQLEIYFGKYLAQLFYSLIAPIILFVFLANVSLKASIILLICVPLIPMSIVFVQKIAKKTIK